MYLKELGKAVIDGVISIPADLAYGARRTYEDIAGSHLVREQNKAERQRIWYVLKKAFDLGASEEAGPISKIVKIILTDFYDILPDATIEVIAKKAGLGTSYMSGRMSTQIGLTTLVVRKLAIEIALKASVKRAVKFGVGAAVSAFLLQGLMERASEASKRLRRTHPKIHASLKLNDLDMAFILVEDSMKPILNAIEVHGKNKEEFNQLIEGIINEN